MSNIGLFRRRGKARPGERDSEARVTGSKDEPQVAMKYEMGHGYSYARDRLGAGMAWDGDLGGDEQSGVRWPVPSFLVGPSDEKTLRALENVVAVIDEYVSSSRHLYGGRTVIAGVDFLEPTQRLNQLRTQSGGLNAIKRADAEVPIIRPILAGLKMLVLVSDCGVTRDKVPDDVAELLQPNGPREVDRVIEYLLEQLRPTADEVFQGQPTAGQLPKQVQGVLVMSRREVENAQVLLQEIIDQQRGEGHTIDPNAIATTRVGDVNDQAYVYAAIRSTFETFGGADLIDRTRVFSFQAPDGNEGKYFVLFDRA